MIFYYNNKADCPKGHIYIAAKSNGRALYLLV